MAQRCPVERVEVGTDVRIGALTLALPNDFERQDILVKDVARWRYQSSKAMLTIESGADLSDYPSMREKLKLATEFREYKFNIAGVRATNFTLVSKSDIQNADDSAESTYVSGLYIPEREQAARILLTYESKSKSTFVDAQRIFCSARLE